MIKRLFFNSKFVTLCIFAFSLMCLIPNIITSGYMYDDVFNSNASSIAFFGSSVGQLTFDQILNWIGAGRIFIFSFYAYFLFSIVNSVVVYKLLIIISILINYILIFYFVKRYTRRIEIAWLALLFFPLFCNMSCTYFSPIYGFHSLVQTTFSLCLLSLIFLIKYYENQKARYMVLSVVTYFIAIFMYELAYVFIIIHILICLTTSPEQKYTKKFLSLIPVLSIWGFGIATNIVVKICSTAAYSGSSINIDVRKIVDTFFYQLSGSFSIIRYVVEQEQYQLPINFVDVLRNLNLYDIIITILFIILVISIFCTLLKSKAKEDCNKEKNNFLPTILFALMLVILPAALISLSSRYQSELSWGKGYLMFYVSSFGFSICLASLVFFCITSFKGTVKVFISSFLAMSITICGSVGLILNQQLGRITVDTNNSYQRSADLVQNAADCGIFDIINDNDVIIGVSNSVFDQLESAVFYTRMAKKKIQACSINEYSNLVFGEKNTVSNNIVIDYTGKEYIVYNLSDGKKSGIVLLAELENFNGGNPLCTGPLYAYVETEYAIGRPLYEKIQYNETSLRNTVLCKQISVITNNEKSSLYSIELNDTYYQLTQFSFELLDNNIDFASDDSLSIDTGFYTFGCDKLFCTSENTSENSLILTPQSIQYGPYTSLSKGDYCAKINGNGLLNADYDVWSSALGTNITVEEVSRTNDEIIYRFTLVEDVSDLEFRTFNNSDTSFEFYNIEIQRK